ncbi:hypothetical protein Hanom_Chr08g00713641 [Helianthus anomalus]
MVHLTKSTGITNKSWMYSQTKLYQRRGYMLETIKLIFLYGIIKDQITCWECVGIA